MTQQDALFNQVNHSVILRTMEGIINFWNRRAEELYGWGKEEAIGRVSHDLLRTQFPKPLADIESELVQKGKWEGKLVHVTRDGGRVVVESRWILDLTEQPGAVVEINSRATDSQSDPAARSDSSRVHIGRQEPLPASKSARANDFPRQVANIVLTGGACVCMLVSVYLIYRDAWYWGFPAAIAGLLVLALKLAPFFRIRIALVLFSTTASIYAAEILTTVVDVWISLPSVVATRDMQERASLAKQAGVEFDMRSTREVVRDLRKRGIDAYPAVSPYELFVSWPLTLTEDQAGLKSKIIINGTEVLPLSGLSNKLSVLCTEGGEYTIYYSDEHGFHNPEGLWNRGGAEIAALGDSFTHGFCVSSDQNFVALIRKHYPATLNLGMLGDGPLLMLATLQEYLQTVKPKIVLWFYFEGNDLRDLGVEKKHPLLMRYVTDSFRGQGLVHRQAEIDHALAAYLKRFQDERPDESMQFIEALTSDRELPKRIAEIARLAHLRQRLGLVLQSVRKPDPAVKYGDVLELFAQVLTRADESVSAWGGKLYFVYLPEWEPFGNPANVDGRRDLVLKTVQRLGIPVIDIHQAFQAQKDPLMLFPFRIDGHYNEEGHRVVAQEVLRAISVDN